MRPLILQLDDALDRQDALTGRVRAEGGQVLAARDLGPAMRLWSRASTLVALRSRLGEIAAPAADGLLVFAGSGDFHHVTPLLVARAAAAADEPVTVLHFDNHPDWVRQARGRHCGSWVGEAARLSGVAKVITIGVCSPDIGRKGSQRGDLALIDEDRLDLYAWRAPDGGGEVALESRSWPTISAMGEAAFIARLAAEIPTRAIYVTIDKDVLAAEGAVTNWDQGQASVDFLIEAITAAASGRRVVGADVVGDWSAPVYGDGPVAWALKRGEAFLDQPRTRPEPAAASALNEAVNLRLLDLFSGLAS
ncbi:arginase family protein [Phenylobacterium sp.]|uniref:arginase family protein n=1 Tax=Phenylobacterium sp. TaxID=1871053 RepID=UPI0035670107